MRDTVAKEFAGGERVTWSSKQGTRDLSEQKTAQYTIKVHTSSGGKVKGPLELQRVLVGREGQGGKWEPTAEGKMTEGPGPPAAFPSPFTS